MYVARVVLPFSVVHYRFSLDSSVALDMAKIIPLNAAGVPRLFGYFCQGVGASLLLMNLTC